MRTIAIFQYGWALQCHTINLANIFLERSYKVHLFVFDCSTNYIDKDNDITKGVEVHYVEPDKPAFIVKVVDKIYYKLFNKWLFKKAINPNAISYSSKVLNGVENLTLLGVEKKGLAWAGITNDKLNDLNTLIYYSLELYETNPGWFGEFDFEESRKLEIKYHHKSQFTIIQDYLRSVILFKYNKFPTSKILKLPVSIRGNEDNTSKSNISDGLNILYFGLIEKRRNILEILESFSRINFKANLRLHGPAHDSNFIVHIKNQFKSQNIEITTNLLNEYEITDLMKNIHIGICFYSNDNINDRLTAFSSEKLARYFKFGIPIISFYNESYMMLMDNIKCGVLIHNYNELEFAVTEIVNNYDLYTRNAKLAYDKYYLFDNNIDMMFNDL